MISQSRFAEGETFFDEFFADTGVEFFEFFGFVF